MIQLSPIVKHLILANLVVFVVLNLAANGLLPDSIDFFLAKYMLLGKSSLILNRAGAPFHPAQIVTSFFAHIEIFHFLFNMLALASLAPMVEMVIGQKRFLSLYLFCGVFAGVVLAFLDPSPAPVLGASTAVSGVFAAFAMMFPERKISFFFLPPIEARKLLIGAAVISGVLMLVDLKGGDTGRISHFGHLAGMLGALVYGKIERFLPFRD